MGRRLNPVAIAETGGTREYRPLHRPEHPDAALSGIPVPSGLASPWAILTLGIYTFIWTYKTQDEIKRYSGNGVGGVLGLVIYILISPVTYFLVPSETRYMYEDLDDVRARLRDLRPLVPAAADRQPDLVHSGAGSAQPLLGEQGSYRLKPAWILGTRPGPLRSRSALR